MSTARRLHHAYEEYLGAQEMSDLRLEFHDGEITRTDSGWDEREVRASERWSWPSLR